MAYDLAKLVQWYEEAEDATHSARKLSERDRDYYDNKQLTSSEEATLKARGQPSVIINRIKPKVDYLLGTERQTRTDPKAAPRTPMDEDAAHAATDAIRFVCDTANFPKVRSDVFDNMGVEGAGGAICEWDGKKITIKRISWDRLFWDPHSRERDFSDAKYTGIVVWMDRDDAIARYPESKELIESAVAEGELSTTYEDKPARWIDKRRNRVKLCQIYFKEGGVEHFAVYTKAGFVTEPKPSEYMDEDGVPMCPLKLVSCHVDRENNRYGIVRQLISIQDEINKRRSKALHLISVRQFRSERGAVEDVARAKKEAAKPDGWIETNPGFEFELLKTGDMAAAQFQLLQEAKGEIDTVGASAYLTGKDDDAQSGRALQARQQGGMMELGPLFDALKMWQKSVYECIWCMVKQFWTGETWVRVTDDENNVKFVGLNQPQKDEMGMPMVDPATGQQVLQNDVSKMNVDIILEDVPDTINIQAEQFQMLTEIAKAYGPEVIPPDIIIEASSLRNKKALLEKMRGEGQDPAAAQAQQEAQQLQKAGVVAEVEKTQSETEKNMATAEKPRAEIGHMAHGMQQAEMQTAMSADKQAFDMQRGERDDQFRATEQQHSQQLDGADLDLRAEQQQFTQSLPPK